MSKGTPSFGKRGRGKKTHIRCPRCGKFSFNRRQEVCASCGFGKSKKLNN